MHPPWALIWQLHLHIGQTVLFDSVLLKFSLRLGYGFRLRHWDSSQFRNGNLDPGKHWFSCTSHAGLWSALMQRAGTSYLKGPQSMQSSQACQSLIQTAVSQGRGPWGDNSLGSRSSPVWLGLSTENLSCSRGESGASKELHSTHAQRLAANSISAKTYSHWNDKSFLNTLIKS